MSRHQSNRGFSRTDRVSDQIQKELAALIQQGIKDPRVTMVTVSGVKVSRDFSFADIYITSLDDLLTDEAESSHSDKEKETNNRQKKEKLVEVLQNAAGFLRTELSRVLKLRTTPKLRFHYDEVIEKGSRIESLIKQALPESDEDI